MSYAGTHTDEKFILTLRVENRLDTHDLAIPIDAGATATEAARQFRVLLLAPSWMSASNLLNTLDRIHRFTSLTGGQDIAVVFLLNPPKISSFISVKDLSSTNNDLEAGTRGVFAYTQLEAALLQRDDIPHVPILPLASVEDLPKLLSKHIATLSRKPQVAPAHTSSFGMLQISTTEPPMDQQTAYFATDCFDSLHEMAVACTQPEAELTSSSPLFRASGGPALQSDFGQSRRICQTSGAGEGSGRLRDLVGEQKYRELIDFWLDEWIVE